jgi:hypothetical protein
MLGNQKPDGYSGVINIERYNDSFFRFFIPNKKWVLDITWPSMFALIV